MTRLKVTNKVAKTVAKTGTNIAPIRQRKAISAFASSAVTHSRASHLNQGTSTHPIQTQLVQTHRSLEQIYRLERRCIS